MEVMIDNLLPSILKKYDNICKCEKCIDDIKAMSLNKLKPLYIATEKGYIYTKMNEIELQFTTDIVRELTKAVEIVSNNPRH